MAGLPLLLADKARARQFALIGQTRRLLRDGKPKQLRNRLPWVVRCKDGYAFAATSLGPGWVFDPYARKQRSAELKVSRKKWREATPAQHGEQLHDLTNRLRFGPLSQRMLWAIHQLVLSCRQSVVRPPDCVLAVAIWGQDDQAWPRHWRKQLTTILEDLSWLHIAECPDSGIPSFGAETALLTHSSDLRSSPEDDYCGDECPARGGPRHHHYLINVGRGFLGVLEQFSVSDVDVGVREYEFPVRGKSESTLRRVGKTGNLVSVYLPAILGSPSVCSSFTHRQTMLLQAIIRETTRQAKLKRRDYSDAEVVCGNQIPNPNQPRKSITCPLLESNENYVGFNGNKKRKGLGYRLCTLGGWLAKAGYDSSELPAFLNDLTILADRLGLIPVAIHRETLECMDASSMSTLVLTRQGQRVLDKMLLRIYAPANYIDRWNCHFQWPQEPRSHTPNTSSDLGGLVEALKRRKISQRDFANGLGVDPAFVSKILHGKKPFPPALMAKAQTWVTSQPLSQRPFSSGKLVVPAIAEHAASNLTVLDVALAYHDRGWSVVPQYRREKKPKVKWKEFQERQPTKKQLASWFGKWPGAGIAVVLGPVSNLLVIDVDGEDADKTLIEHLGHEPTAPKVLSGSRKPHRYHLFFQCPDLPTKAKSTPWHPNLEFRGKGGILVIPPSVHASGQRYLWQEGQSLDDLELPPLPPEIMDCLKPVAHLPPATSYPAASEDFNSSASTQKFLAGQYADGPRWNDRLFLAACDLVGRGVLFDDAMPLLIAGAQPWNRGDEGLACRTINSAFSQPRIPGRY
jgi:transcriptional regulator with XRE-family HTH domain